MGCKKKGKLSPCLVSLVHLTYFIVFGGFWGFCCTAFYRRSQGWTELCSLERPERRSCFLTKIWICCWIFPSNKKKDSPFLPFLGWLGNIFLLTVRVRMIFASLLALLIFLHTLLPSFQLPQSLKSTLATALVWQLLLSRRVGLLGEAYTCIFNRIFLLCTHLVL